MGSDLTMKWFKWRENIENFDAFPKEKGTLLKSIFDVHNVKSAFTTALKKRENKRRTYIIAIGWYFNENIIIY